MKIFTDIKAWIAFNQTRPMEETLGFVPTMGHLHPGHASLMKRSQAEHARTLVSIFVNPTQFNRRDDYEHYPRTLEDDLAYLEHLKIDYCLLPKEEALYHDHYQYQVHETSHPTQLEGRYRPGHVTGMLTVVLKLLQIAQAKTAYFGEKDYEQWSYITGMARAFFIPTDIQCCPTQREQSGLAYSSRNHRLSPEGRKRAETFAAIFLHTKDQTTLRTRLTEAEIELEYLEDVNDRRFIAIYIEGIRLIDNRKL